MLLVIFGAGASYDSVPHFVPTRSDHEHYRPPLANQLFDDRNEFVKVMRQFPDCLPLIPHLRRGVDVEQRLAEFQDQANLYPARHRQLAAIRYYLHVMLWECQINWSNQHHGITNYATLLDAIERWRYESEEQVCFITFNYDTMLEDSMRQVLGFEVRALSSYLNQANYSLIKLHGSVNWAHHIEEGFPTPPIQKPQQLIDVASQLKISDTYALVSGYPMLYESQVLVFPALAIPVAKKDYFECPQEHIAALAGMIPRVTKLVTIGWRATEDRFLTMLKNQLNGLNTQNIDLLIVSGNPGAAKQTLQNLNLDVPAHRCALFSAGFSDLTHSMGWLDGMLRQKRSG